MNRTSPNARLGQEIIVGLKHTFMNRTSPNARLGQEIIVGLKYICINRTNIPGQQEKDKDMVF